MKLLCHQGGDHAGIEPAAEEDAEPGIETPKEAKAKRSKKAAKAE